MAINIESIEPLGVYRASEACKLIPSSRGGSLHIQTWHRWRVAGRFQAFKIGKDWFCHGSEILKLLHADQAQPMTVRSPARREAAYRQARRERAQLD